MVDHAARGGRKRWRLALIASVLVAVAVVAQPLADWIAVARLVVALTGEGREGPAPRPVAWRADGVELAADLYLPEGCAPLAFALIGGLAPDGRDDTRLVAFARVLGHAGFAAFVPDVPSLAGLEPGRATPDEIAAALGRLAAIARASGQTRIAAIGVSFSVGPLVRVVAEGRAPEVGLVVGIGGYRDLAAVVTYFTTGWYRAGPDGPWARDEPNPRAAWAFLRANADRVADSGDRALLSEIARRKLADPGAEVAEPVARLAGEGRAAYALAANRERDRVPELVAAIRPWLGPDLDALDPSALDLSRFPAAVILVHGADDRVIPVSESRALAAALPPDRVRLFVPDRLNHVRPDDRDLASLWTLARATRAVLREARRLGGAGPCLVPP